ncbi:hypothetical protein KKF91_22465 [Myxococcota bacterium]|nr:hypothetical protein [Myxococcota bacterium]
MKHHLPLYLLPLTLILSCGGDEATPATNDAAPRDGGPRDDGGGGGGGGALAPLARFELAEPPAATDLGDIPWPSDLYRGAQGALDLTGLRKGTGGIYNLIIDALEAETPGFSTAATLYLAFAEPPALGDLLGVGACAAHADCAAGQSCVEGLCQDPARALDAAAPIQLINIDPTSPERGQRAPLLLRYRAEATGYLPAHTLSIRLVEGMALRPKTTYALIASAAFASAPPAFEALLEAQGDGPAWTAYAPLRAFLQSQPLDLGIASVFTTQDPIRELLAARDFLYTLPPPPLLDVRSVGVDETGRFEVFEGHYRAPRFQEGEIPYTRAGEGAIRFDANGRPIVQGEEALRFALSVPVPMPDHPTRPVEFPLTGWPVVLYAHGTGGNYRSFIERSNVASVLAGRGIAVMGIDQLHHGPRANGDLRDPSFLFFNFQVPTAGRDNLRQAALDLVSQLRFTRALQLDLGLSALPLTLNPEAIAFMGHSQGGLNGPLLLAIEPDILGGMLSGAGSNIAITLEQKRAPYDINQLIAQVLGLPADDPLDRWHPAATLLQTFIDPGDAVNYARLWFDEPPEGHAPKSVMMSSGLTDPYTPPDSTAALAAAGRVPLMEPISEPIPALSFLGIPSAGVPPFRANVAGGQASAGITQFPEADHFVIFETPAAWNRYANFIEDLCRRPGTPPTIY